MKRLKVLLVMLLLQMVMSAPVAAQTVESVLRALQERQMMLDIRAQRMAASSGWNMIAWGTQNGTAIPAFPEDHSITDFRTMIRVLNAASKKFDEMKGKFVAYDAENKRCVNARHFSTGQEMAGDAGDTGDAVFHESGGKKYGYFGFQPEVTTDFKLGVMRLPSVGTFDEANWRGKLKQLASNINQLKALSWPMEGDEASLRCAAEAGPNGTWVANGFNWLDHSFDSLIEFPRIVGPAGTPAGDYPLETAIMTKNWKFFREENAVPLFRWYLSGGEGDANGVPGLSWEDFDMDDEFDWGEETEATGPVFDFGFDWELSGATGLRMEVTATQTLPQGAPTRNAHFEFLKAPIVSAFGDLSEPLATPQQAKVSTGRLTPLGPPAGSPPPASSAMEKGIFTHNNGATIAAIYSSIDGLFDFDVAITGSFGPALAESQTHMNGLYGGTPLLYHTTLNVQPSKRVAGKPIDLGSNSPPDAIRYYFTVAGVGVVRPEFPDIVPSSVKAEGQLSRSPGEIEVTIANYDLVRIHAGRGNGDLNQEAWLGTRMDGFGSMVFNGSPTEFELIYEENPTQFEAPIGERKHDSADEFTEAEKLKSGWKDRFAYIAEWFNPRLRQVKGSDVLVDITYQTGYKKTLKFYWASELGANPNPGSPYGLGGVTAFKIIELKNPTAENGLPNIHDVPGEGGAEGSQGDGYCLTLLEDNQRQHEIVLENKGEADETFTVSLREGSGQGEPYAKTEIEIHAAPSPWEIVETVDGVSTKTEVVYDNPPTTHERPVASSVKVGMPNAQEAEKRKTTVEWWFVGDLAYVKKVTHEGPTTWAPNGSWMEWDNEGFFKKSQETLQGKTVLTEVTWENAERTTETKLNGSLLSKAKTIHSGEAGNRFKTVTQQVFEGAVAKTVGTITHRDASGAGEEAGSPWSMEKVVYAGGYQETVKPTWLAGALTLVTKSGWTPEMKTGMETTTRFNRFGGLETGTEQNPSSVTKARKYQAVAGGGEVDVVVSRTVVTETTAFGAPKVVSDLRGRTMTQAYETQAGVNWGRPKLATSAGVTAGVTTYDWLGRATQVDAGHETFNVNLSDILKPEVTSASNANHLAKMERTALGDPVSVESKFGVISAMTFTPGGGGTVEVDGQSTSYESDAAGMVSKVLGGLGTRGVRTDFGVETVEGKNLLWVSSTELKNTDDSDSALTIKTYYDAKGRVVQVSRPKVNGGDPSVEKWIYDDDTRTVTHTPATVPAPGRPAQTTTTVLEPDGSMVTVKVENEARLLIKQRAEGGALVEIVEELKDSEGGGWKQVSKTSENPQTGTMSMVPYDLAANATVVTESIPAGPNHEVTRTVTDQAANETVTTTIRNGLVKDVNGKSGGVKIEIDNIAHTDGHVDSVSGKVGKAPVGYTVGNDRRISTVTSLEGVTSLVYPAVDGYRVEATLNGKLSVQEVDKTGDLKVLSLEGEVPSLTGSTEDTATGSTQTLEVPGHPGNTLQIDTNVYEAVTKKRYNGGGLDETYTLFEDGSVQTRTVGGSEGSGSSETTTVTWDGAYQRNVSFTGASSLTVAEEFFKTMARKSVELMGGPGFGDKREFSYERDAVKTETHLNGLWTGVTVTYGQDAQGRLGTLTVTGAGLNRTFTLEYDGNSRLWKTQTAGVGGAQFEAETARDGDDGQRTVTTRGPVTTTRSYGAAGTGLAGLLTEVENVVAGGTDFAFGYGARDEKKRMTGRTSELGHGWTSLSYVDGDGKDRGQLNSAQVANLPSGQTGYAYNYNKRGTRTGLGAVATQTVNALDQVTGRTLATRGFGVMGAMAPGPNSNIEAMNEQTAMTWLDIGPDPVTGAFFYYWNVLNSYLDGAAFRAETKLRATVVGGGAGGTDAVAETDVYTVVPPAVETLTYDKQGRLKSDAFWIYYWDAAGRLYHAERKEPMRHADSLNEYVDFSYDADGRMVRRSYRRFTFDENWAEETSWMLWAGWLPIYEERWKQEPGSIGEMLPARWFQWGPDQTGTLSGAAGIGGLMAIHEEGANGSIERTLVPVDDGLGNVVATINAANGERVATYHYGPFGEWIGGTGELEACPFRWQTKWYDPVTELGFWGFRHYSARHGRWLSRDPLGEAGGFNLYAYCGNDPVNRWDLLGMDSRFKWDPETSWEVLKMMGGQIGGGVAASIDVNSVSRFGGGHGITPIPRPALLPSNRPSPFESLQNIGLSIMEAIAGTGNVAAALQDERSFSEKWEDNLRIIKDGIYQLEDPEVFSAVVIEVATLPFFPKAPTGETRILRSRTLAPPKESLSKTFGKRLVGGPQKESLASYLRSVPPTPSADISLIALGSRPITALTLGTRVRLRIPLEDLTPLEVAAIENKYGIANIRIASRAEKAQVGAGVPYRSHASKRFVRDTMQPEQTIRETRIPEGMNVDEYVSRHVGGRQIHGNQHLMAADINQWLGTLEYNAVRGLPEGTIIQEWIIEFF